MFRQYKWILIHGTVILSLLYSNTWAISPKNAVTFAGIVNNITVYALEDKSSLESDDMSKSLKLNVSWMPPSKGRQPSSYSIIVTSISKETDVSRSECTENSVLYTVQNVTQLSLLVPRDKLLNSMPEMQIHPNCTYKIQVHANPRARPGGELPEVIYTVPECVGSRCDCTGARNTLPVPTVRAIQTTEKVIINWNVTSNSNVHFYEISIGVPILTSKEGRTVYNITQISKVNVATYTFTWDSKIHDQYVKVKSGYEIFVTATDHRGCLGTRGNFTVVTAGEIATSYENIIWISNGVIVCIIVLGFTYLFIAIRRVRKNRAEYLKFLFSDSRRQTIPELSRCKPEWPEEACCEVRENDEFEVPYKCINLKYELDNGQFGKVYLGKGQFGKVYLGSLNNNVDTLVAVKMSQCSDASNEPEARRQLLEEIQTMKKTGPHPHLVSLIGCCTSPDNPICILLEYMEGGDLLAYLHSRRKTESDAIPLCDDEEPVSRYVNIIERDKSEDGDLQHDTIEKQQFLKFALDIARGMEHLEDTDIIHRDLAARNILLTSDLTLKVSDFGLSRNGIYVINNVDGKVRQLPIRWMSPEAVRDYTFSSKSDVWSFGIVLWEIGTLGAFPYPSIQDKDLLRYLARDKCRLARPDTTSHDIYEIMCSCWNTSPQKRPSFAQLVVDLQTLRESSHSAHETSNPCYMLSLSQ
ncbi:PREDICTED: vascular endothelial growth factor receptor 3-like [Dinoponera quadriceps]|uniref:Vascular endothelial growth factor receptor 3-like n=1 Tax=Dinoponera quadriceps TaxID=609295 RepID=A0A6P3XYC1_DINQU|nr:PREDICTED: vascular endothelial growth factor receptor 3-like [Dinoponera quadriceps]